MPASAASRGAFRSIRRILVPSPRSCAAKRSISRLSGPELPLSRGIADAFEASGDLLLGPVQRAARLESSKVFAKEFMHRYNVPTARYRSCDSAAQAIAVLKSGEFTFPVVLKADGLAAGKGVVISPDAAPRRSGSARHDDRQAVRPRRRPHRHRRAARRPRSVLFRAERRHTRAAARFGGGSQTRPRWRCRSQHRRDGRVRPELVV